MSPPAVPTSPVRRRRGWRRRALRVLLLALGTLALLLVILYLGRSTLLAPLVEARLTALARKHLGAEVQVERIGGDWVRELRLEGLQWHALAADAPLQFAAADQALVRYSLRAALAGRTDWIELIDVEGVRVRADFAAPRAEQPPKERKGTRLPAVLPRIEARDIEAQVLLPGGRVLHGRGGSVRVGPGPQAQAIELALAEGLYEGPDLGPRSGAIRAQLSWDGRVLRLDEASVDGVRRLHEGSLDLSELETGRFTFALAADAFAGELRARGTVAPGATDLGLRTAGIGLGPALAFFFPAHARALAGELDLEASLLLRAGQAPTGALRLTARDLAYGEQRLARLDARGGFAGATLSIDELVALEGESRLDARGLLVPLDAGSVLEVLHKSRGEVELVLVDIPALLPGGDPLTWVPPHRLELRARLEGERALLESGALRTRGGGLEVRSGELTWGPTRADLLRLARLDLALRLGFDDLSDLGTILETDPWSGSLEGDVRLTGAMTELQGALDLRGRAMRIAGFAVGDVTALARVDAAEVAVERLQASTPLGDLSLTGSWRPGTAEFAGVRGSVVSRELARVLPGTFLAGEAELEATLDGPWRSPRGTFRLVAAGLVAAARPELEVESLEARGQLLGQAARVESLELLAAGSRVSASGLVSTESWNLPVRIALDALHAEREGLDLALERPVELEVRADGVRFEGMALQGTAGRFLLTLRASDEELFALLDAPAVDPMPVLAPLLPRGYEISGVSGRFELAHSQAQTRMATSLLIERLHPGDGAADFRLSANATLEDERVQVHELLLESPDARASVRGGFPLSLLRQPLLGVGAIDLVADVKFPELARVPWEDLGVPYDFSGGVQGDLALEGTWEKLVGTLSFQARALDLRKRGEGAGFYLGPAEIEGRLILQDDLRLSDVRITAPGAARIGVTGTWGISEHLRGALEGDLAPLRSAPLDLEAQLLSSDLSFLGAFAPMLRRIDGEVRASLGVSGSLDAPLVHGLLELEEGLLRAYEDWPAVDGLAARVVFDGRTMQIERLVGQVGAGPFTARGTVTLVPAVHFDVQFMGAEVLLATSPTLRVRADAELQLAGPLEALQLSGQLQLREGRWTRDLDYLPGGGNDAPDTGPRFELFSLPEPPLANMQLDIGIGYVTPFRIENNLARSSLRPDLRLTGSGRAPELTGTVFLGEGKVTLPSSSLRLVSGTVVFTRARPLVPLLDILLETRMRGYDIRVRLEGTASDPDLDLSAVPPLSNEEIIVLLLSGQAPEGGLGRTVGMAAAQDVALFVGRDIVDRWFGASEGDGESFFERIEWQSGADVSEEGTETQEVTLRLSEKERRLGRTVYLRGERDIYERINVGVRIVYRWE